MALVLEDIMESRFNTVCEDESPDEIGEILVQMFHKCSSGDFTMVDGLLAKAAVRQNIVNQSQGLANGDVMDSEDEGEDGLEEQSHQISAACEAVEKAQEAACMETEAPSIPDPDGWVTVPAKNAKKGKRKT